MFAQQYSSHETTSALKTVIIIVASLVFCVRNILPTAILKEETVPFGYAISSLSASLKRHLHLTVCHFQRTNLIIQYFQWPTERLA